MGGGGGGGGGGEVIRAGVFIWINTECVQASF